MVHDQQVPLDVFVGRAAELAQVAEVVARAKAGQPWLVSIEGDPGATSTRSAACQDVSSCGASSSSGASPPLSDRYGATLAAAPYR
ncbi:MAG: hypothetical protein WAK82_05475, partial [Streptosporangiaceae bacterium]